MTITCVITSYNNCDYLKHAVQSVADQTKPVDEIIVADDASTDGSRELIRSLAAERARIRPIFRERNLGVARNRDFATREATGDFVTWLDGDDFYYDNKIELECRAIASRTAGVACSNLDIVKVDGTIISFRDVSSFVAMSREEKVATLAFRRGPIPSHFLIPKAIYERTGGIKSKFEIYEDWDFKIRLAAMPINWVWSGCVGMAYRQTGTGLSSVPVEEHAKAMRLVLAENEALLTEVLGMDGYRRAMRVVPPAKSRRRGRKELRSIVRLARRWLVKEPGI